jgi:hypothetical protein
MSLKHRTDRHDTHAAELTLIRAGHHLWRDRLKKGLTVNETQALYAALEIVWEAKGQLRAELAAGRKERGRVFAERMREELLTA